MKLKNILLENNKKEKLLKLLKSGNYYGVREEKKFYRGEKADIDTFKRKTIRNNRKPLDTPGIIDSMVECVRKNHYSDKPSRQKSKFATGKQFVAKSYGQVYYMFVPKSANSWWSRHDAWTDYFSRIDGGLENVKKSYENLSNSNIDDVKNKSEILPTIKFGYYLKNGKNKKVCEVIENSYHNIKNYDDYNVKYSNFPNLKPFLYDVSKVLESFESYFHELKKYEGDIDSNSIRELTVEGDHYLVANMKWFDQNVKPML